MSEPNSSPPPEGQFLVYQAEDGKLKLEVRFEGETVWLTQQHMAELFQTTKQNIGQHLKSIFAESELLQNSVVKDSFTTAADGKNYATRFYNLDAIISVGYRVKSAVATRFRIWATQRLREFIVKGFTLDDERLKNPDQPFDFFEELARRIQDIRTSERRFYQKITDIYATSVDYMPNAKVSQQFFATVQNKMYWAAQRHHPQGGCLHRQELPRCPGTRNAEPDRHGLHRICRTARSATQSDDHARLDYQARRVPKILRARVAGPRRKNLRRAGKNESGAGIPAVSDAPRYATPPRGRRLRASHEATTPSAHTEAPEEKEMSQFNTPAAVESRGTSVERPFSFSFQLYTFLHLPPIHHPKSAPLVTSYQLPRHAGAASAQEDHHPNNPVILSKKMLSEWKNQCTMMRHFYSKMRLAYY